jgi:hypothetical protein
MGRVAAFCNNCASLGKSRTQPHHRISSLAAANALRLAAGGHEGRPDRYTRLQRSKSSHANDPGGHGVCWQPLFAASLARPVETSRPSSVTVDPATTRGVAPELLPGSKRIAVHNFDTGQHAGMKEVRGRRGPWASSLNSSTRKPEGLEPALQRQAIVRRWAHRGKDGLFIAYPRRLWNWRRNWLPAIYGSMELVEAGGLMAYGPNTDLYRRAAVYVDKIFKGELRRPACRAADEVRTDHQPEDRKALGITFPPAIARGKSSSVIERLGCSWFSCDHAAAAERRSCTTASMGLYDRFRTPCRAAWGRQAPLI